MKFSIENQKGENIANLLRKAGYRFFEEKGNEFSFFRPLAPGGYPRFHIFTPKEQSGGNVTCAIHLDQKRPIYKFSRAHSGEYDGDVVAGEIQRIQKIF